MLKYWGTAPAALALSGCLAYNIDCSLEVSNPEETVAFLGGETPIAEEVTRTQETFLGGLVADAFLDFVRAQQLKADGAVVNAGSIREDGLCERREALRAGRLKRKTLRDVLPFDDELVVVELTEVQLENALEHAVASLNTGRRSGAFLQISGFGFRVDCEKSPESVQGAVRTPGRRIEAIFIAPSGDPKECHATPGSCRWIYPEEDADPAHRNDVASPTETVRLVMTTFLARGGDGYADFKPSGADHPRILALAETRIPFQAVADHLMKARSTAGNPLPVETDPAAPRIVRNGCLP